jgi:hypothetical protein
MNRRHLPFRLAAFAILLVGLTAGLIAEETEPGAWQFAASGDSRNCGDVVMPAIAQSVLSHHAEFYWHLGDFRAIYRLDEDYSQRELAGLRVRNPFVPSDILLSSLPLGDYYKGAWADFIRSQIDPFGKLPVFLGIGNHEVIPPMSREAWVKQFNPWLDRSAPRDPNSGASATPRSYYHWKMRGVDFITLDNADNDQFDAGQMKWLQALIAADDSDSSVKTIVAGMHKALPDSISFGHSMNESTDGTSSGREAYNLLLDARDHHGKKVYILASHSHYFMQNIYNTGCWRKNGGVLPGWITGTTGALRYRLPVDISGADFAVTDVYGYLLATVHSDGTVAFHFQQVDENGVPADIVKEYSAEFVNWCFSENRDLTINTEKRPDCPR